MLNIQQFLVANTLDALKEQLGVNFKRHPKYPNLVHLSYDQIESPKDHPVVMECRGIVLDQNHDWRVVAFPFSRFANYGESWAAPIDWNTARVQSKLDGSMCTLFNYNGEWLVCTKGSPDAGGSVGDYNFTFADLFWQTFKKQGLDSINLDSSLCYIWELTSMYNRVVVRYQEDKLTLIGLRDILRGLQEIPVSTMAGIFPVVREWPLNNLDAVIAASQALDPVQEEGYVVVDGSFNRNKIKSPKYVLIHHMRDGFGQRRIIDLIRMGEGSEFLALFPEFQKVYNDTNGHILMYCQEVDAEYERIKHLTDRKAFAEAAKKSKNMSALMTFFNGQFATTWDYLFYNRWVHKKDGVETLGEYRHPAWKIEDIVGLKPDKPKNLEE